MGAAGANRPASRRETKPALVPMQANRWAASPQKAEFLTCKGVVAMKVLPNSGPIVAQGVTFANGTIEFDVELQKLGSPFVGLYLRWQGEEESEFVYLRTSRAG